MLIIDDMDEKELQPYLISKRGQTRKLIFCFSWDHKGQKLLIEAHDDALTWFDPYHFHGKCIKKRIN